VSEPEVSVLMAVRNGGPFLDEALRSIVAQTFTAWEMIAVDDASTDGTPGVLEAWSRREPRLRVVANAVNQGQTASLNQGLSHCRGKWVARQDADDVSEPSRFERQVAHLRANEGTALLGTQGILIDDAGRKTGLLDVPREAAGIAWAMPFLNPFLHTAVMFRRDVVAGEFGGYDEKFRIAQDYDLWSHIAARHAAANLPGRLVRYRNSAGSLSRAGRERAFAEAEEISSRVASEVFGRPWTDEERALVDDFRQGLNAGRRRAFWALVRPLAREFARRYPARSDGPRSVAASWHLRVAGSVGGLAACREILAALRADPVRTAGWLGARWT
jgi:glycosyltransferase involved in cell wall biosynthesis